MGEEDGKPRDDANPGTGAATTGSDKDITRVGDDILKRAHSVAEQITERVKGLTQQPADRPRPSSPDQGE